jgi:fructosamine-3-kinase
MDKQEVTAEQFYANQRIESLARQNAQQALRIADLEAQLALIQAQQQQEQPAMDTEEVEASPAH